MLAIQPFLTAYDPSDLPGGSVDPLGFDRGYVLLAEKILPGLTNVANRPRYFSALCAAISLSDEQRGGSDRVEARQARYQRRLGAVQRLERFWTLACALASGEDDALDPAGIRGIRYVEAAVRRIKERADTSTEADFKLLSRQVTYGMVGIYGSVADGLRLIDRGTLDLGPDLGRRLGESFVAETEMPPTLRRAVVEDEGAVGLAPLRKWGERAHLDAQTGPEEARVMLEALAGNDTRRRMTELLHHHPTLDGETEIHRLHRICQALAAADDHPDLREALRAIVAFEEGFRLALLAFFRLLWFCQAEAPYAIELDRAAQDPVLITVHEQMKGAWRRLDAAVAEGETRAFKEHTERLADVQGFLQAAAGSSTAGELVERVLLRHRDVQRAKLDGGRPKMPWLEINKGKVVPTLSATQRLSRPPGTVEEMLAHPYRTAAADRLFRAGSPS